MPTLRAVVAHSGCNSNNVTYSGEIMKLIAEQISSSPIPLLKKCMTGVERTYIASNKLVRCSDLHHFMNVIRTFKPESAVGVPLDDVVGLIQNAEIVTPDFERVEVHADVQLSADYDNLFDAGVPASVTPAMIGSGVMDEYRNITEFTVEAFFLAPASDHAMPFCRMWKPEDRILVDASSEEDLNNQFIRLWHLRKGNFSNQPGNRTLYTVGASLTEEPSYYDPQSGVTPMERL